MTINISIPDVGPNLHPQITVLGVGGSGGNAVNNMINSNLEGVDFAIANTDAQALQISNCNKKIQLGIQSTRGLGAGMRPDIGRVAAEETLNEISEMLEGSHMLFIAAGMGGGTGTGAAPVIAKLAREKGILTVGVVTKPFHFEGSQRMKLANKGLEELQQYVDTLLTIPNQNLFRIANEKTTFADAFKMADDVLYCGVRGVTDLMVQPGLINLDFSDVKTVMSEMGKAMMGTGEASGENRSVKAAESAIANPLIDDVSLKGAKGLIINIMGGNDITLYEVDEAANRIKQEVDEDANIIYGTTCDERLEGSVRVSIVATGIDANSVVSPKPLENIPPLSIDNTVYQKKNDYNNENSYSLDSNQLSNEFNNNHQQNLEDTKNADIVQNEDYGNRNLNELDVDDDISSDLSENHEDEINNFVEENVEEKIDIKNSISQTYLEEENIDPFTNNNEDKINLSENIVDDNLVESKIISSEIKKTESINNKKEDLKPSVRKLSLFDTLETTDLEKKPALDDKTEPRLENIEDNDENISDNLVDSGNEFSAEDSAIEDDFNQESEEELLDIPTFLRRQAN